MASIHKLKSSPYWYASYRDASGKQHLKSTKIEHAPVGATPKERAGEAAKNKRLALDMANQLEEAEQGHPTEAHLRKLLAEVSQRANNRRLEFKKPQIYLTEWVERAFRTKSRNTGERYKQVAAEFLESLGPKAEATLNDITPRDVQKFVDYELAAGKSAASIRVETKILSIPFNRAMRQGLILQNPVASVELPEAAHESRTPFTWEQVTAIIKEADGEWKTVVLFGALTGARLGDCVNMRWANVDFPNKLIKFRPAKTSRSKRDLVVPMHPTLENHLLSLPNSDDSTLRITPELAAQKIPGRSGLSRQFHQIMARAGVEQDAIAAPGKSGRIFNHYSFHSLRHTFTSLLHNAGIAPDVRQKLAGHADERSHATYTHTEIETLRRAIAALPTIG